MQTSDAGRKMIELHEGCRYEAYLDGGGIPTICVGHTAGVHMGDTATPDQCDAYLVADLEQTEGAINRLVTATLQQTQFDALSDFVFNVGGGAFGSSTLLHLLNAGDYEGAAGQFGRWVHDANGNVEPGLVTRRQHEATLFLAGTYP